MIFVFFSFTFFALTMSSSVPLHECYINKVKFDLSNINDEGLIGPPDGLRSVSYEFCIPLSDELLAHVLRIDPTIQHFQSSRGRIMCPEGQQLCIAETYSEVRTPTADGVPPWKDILCRLSSLEFIEKFERYYAE